MSTGVTETSKLAGESALPLTHPACLLLPAMSAEEYAGLKEDIRKQGLRRPIFLFEGKILDGRHRAQACEELGIEAQYESWSGTDPVGFVLSENLHRRHLTASQKAMVAAGAIAAHKAAARERQLAGKTLAPRDANPRNSGKAAETVAAAVGVSPRSVERATEIRSHGTEQDVQEVLAGKTTLKAKAREIAERQPATPARRQPATASKAPAKGRPAEKEPTPKDAMQRALAVTAALAELRKVDSALLPEDAERLVGELETALGRYRALLGQGVADA